MDCFFKSKVCKDLLVQYVSFAAVTAHIRLRSDHLTASLRTLQLCLLLLYSSALRLHVLTACGQPPTSYVFLLVHLNVPMVTSASIPIKQLQQHFQSGLLEAALFIAYYYITVPNVQLLSLSYIIIYIYICIFQLQAFNIKLLNQFK